MNTYAVDTDIMNHQRGDTIHFVVARSADAAITKVRWRLLGLRGYYHPTSYWTAKIVVK